MLMKSSHRYLECAYFSKRTMKSLKGKVPRPPSCGYSHKGLLKCKFYLGRFRTKRRQPDDAWASNVLASHQAQP